MKFLFSLVLSLLIFSRLAYSQLKQIPVAKVLSTQELVLNCFDSSGRLTNFCPLGLDGFTVNLFYAYLDKKKGELQLIGRVCMSKRSYSSGVPDVEIFKATKSGNKITDRIHISEVTNADKYLFNAGFFEIIVKIGKNEALFFHHPAFFIREFSVHKLFNNN